MSSPPGNGKGRPGEEAAPSVDCAVSKYLNGGGAASNILLFRPAPRPASKRRIVITPNDLTPGEFVVGLETEGRPYVVIGPTATYAEAVELAQSRSEALGGVPICDFTHDGGNAWADRDPGPTA